MRSAKIGLVAFFSSADGLRIVVEVLAYSCAAGLFVVPIFAAVQAWSGEDRRARVIGAVNTLNSLYMVVGSLATTLLLKLTGLSESDGDGVAWLRQYRRGCLFLRPPADQRRSVTTPSLRAQRSNPAAPPSQADAWIASSLRASQ